MLKSMRKKTKTRKHLALLSQGGLKFKIALLVPIPFYIDRHIHTHTYAHIYIHTCIRHDTEELDGGLNG